MAIASVSVRQTPPITIQAPAIAGRPMMTVRTSSGIATLTVRSTTESTGSAAPSRADVDTR
jgi:hypothetical protein